ncbi:MAG: helix-turn-helix transcriptional regulator [Nitrospira sp. CG24D]|jgi:transcriptional regulator with XRE-family HTH domain|nr:MAG: helix-turn-helix transcriptional regulator [Nitrospira sp. CG24D]
MKDLLRKLGARIKEERKVRGLTQEQLAEKVEITPRYLSRLEGGQQSPSIETLTKLAGIFEIELQELFDFHHIGTPKELRARLSKFMNELDEQKLRLAVRLLKAVVQ